MSFHLPIETRGPLSLKLKLYKIKKLGLLLSSSLAVWSHFCVHVLQEFMRLCMWHVHSFFPSWNQKLRNKFLAHNIEIDQFCFWQCHQILRKDVETFNLSKTTNFCVTASSYENTQFCATSLDNNQPFAAARALTHPFYFSV